VSAAAASPAAAQLAQPSLPAKAHKTPPPGYNILFIFVDQEHFFDKWAFPVPGREFLKKNGTSFTNHQSASQVCSSARSTVYTGQHIQHIGVFDNMGLPWQPNMSTDVVTIGHRLQQIGYHAAYQGKWHLSENLDAAHRPVEASLLKNREIIESYGFVDFLGVGDLIDGPLGGYSYNDFSATSAVAWLRTKAHELKAQGKPWFMAVNLVNPHDVMWVNSDAPGEMCRARGRRPIQSSSRPPMKFTARSGTTHCRRPAISPRRARPAARASELPIVTGHSARPVAGRRSSVEGLAKLLLQLHARLRQTSGSAA
jgi:arylsulfatase A-like enzyme